MMKLKNKNLPVKVDKNTKKIKLVKEVYEKYFQDPLLWFTEVGTGIAVSAAFDRKDLVLSGGQLIQGAIKLDLWNEFLNLLNRQRDKGKVKKVFYQSRQGRINFNELFSYLDNKDTPDKDVFEIMSKIFYASITTNSKTEDEIKAYQYLQISKKLSSIDVLVFNEAYKIYLLEKSGQSERIAISNLGGWEKYIADKIKLPIELVVQSRLANVGAGQAPSTMVFKNVSGAQSKHGLSTLGIAIGDFISKVS